MLFDVQKGKMKPTITFASVVRAYSIVKYMAEENTAINTKYIYNTYVCGDVFIYFFTLRLLAMYLRDCDGKFGKDDTYDIYM